ncbi:hypothetical protein LC653_44875 [Nostoc sp. CHAB 5784]|uniref:hypothetical protein n=1 Tax=Nostoc mirabile TaxID=2907820 RepID=UPI001E4B3C4D|nr:hypothetical protein [Nostoc mirabile]MCC5670708.1 hypothetical protein [Nostoc mirabile CHAB5784]
MSSLEIPLVWGKKAIAEFGRRSHRLLFCVNNVVVYRNALKLLWRSLIFLNFSYCLARIHSTGL